MNGVNKMRFLYSFIINPLIFFAAHLIAIFSSKYRRAIITRYHISSKIQNWLKKQKQRKSLILIHTSSMGEFEHIKFLLKKLSAYDIHIVITFFSPSGYEHIKSHPGVDLFIYTPFDFQFVWKKIYKLLQPSFVVFAKHETWPNYVWTAKKLGIPLFLINAALPSESSRFEPLIRRFYQPIYASFTTIYAISEHHLKNFQKHFPKCQIEFIGDSKFDQVADRKRSTADKEYIPQRWVEGALSIVAGSIHREDSDIIFPALHKLMKEFNEIKLIIIPHDLHENYIAEILQYFSEFGSILFSSMDKLANQRVIVIDKIGILADIYRYGDISFVGGSFRQGIHNVMEPAIYGSPILHGPKHQIAYEAGVLNTLGGSRIIHNEEESYAVFKELIINKDKRAEMGEKARIFSLNNTGTAEKLIQRWQEYLK
jgi:3-deoxy-D-manno-octulosonic-acid transferase